MDRRRVHATFVIVIIVLLTASAFAQSSTDSDTVLDAKLDLLRPLVNKTWVGKLKSPDGKQDYLDSRRFSSVWGGKAIRITEDLEELNTESDGYIYWDSEKGEIRLFELYNNGVVKTGTVSEDNGDIVISGRIVFPEIALDFRNTFHLAENGTLTDKWFRLQNGTWLPGHTIEFRAEAK